MDEEKDAVDWFIMGMVHVSHSLRSSTISFQSAEMIQQPFILICDERVKLKYDKYACISFPAAGQRCDIGNGDWVVTTLRYCSKGHEFTLCYQCVINYCLGNGPSWRPHSNSHDGNGSRYIIKNISTTLNGSNYPNMMGFTGDSFNRVLKSSWC